MKTKEAIGILKEYTGHKGDKWKVSMTGEDIKEFNNIIELLQRGEKFEQIWGERMKIWFDYKADCYWLDDKGFLSVLPILEYIHEKYFPKEDK